MNNIINALNTKNSKETWTCDQIIKMLLLKGEKKTIEEIGTEVGHPSASVVYKTRWVKKSILKEGMTPVDLLRAVYDHFKQPIPDELLTDEEKAALADQALEADEDEEQDEAANS